MAMMLDRWAETLDERTAIESFASVGLACTSLWLLALALLTAAALRDRWRAWRRGPTAEPDDGGPEVDRLIAESMAAWRADVAERIVRRFQGRGLGFPLDLANRDVQTALRLIQEELERSADA